MFGRALQIEAMADPNVRNVKKGETVQFERKGFFVSGGATKEMALQIRRRCIISLVLLHHLFVQFERKGFFVSLRPRALHACLSLGPQCHQQSRAFRTLGF